MTDDTPDPKPFARPKAPLQQTGSVITQPAQISPHRLPRQPQLDGLPERRRGHQSDYSRRIYDRHLREWAKRIETIRANIDFAPSSRGWSYLQEQHGFITKGQF